MKLFRLLRNSKGFTLIELLIVIALLGALAVGLIGALDPFEQLKKGTDTGTRDLVSQIQTAAIRYYSIKNTLPWCDDAGVCVDPDAAGTTLDAEPMVTAIDRMQAAGELHGDFETIQENKLDQITVFGESGVDPRVQVCYIPTSKSFQADPNTKFVTDSGAESGTGGDNCVGHVDGSGAEGDQSCAWCIE